MRGGGYLGCGEAVLGDVADSVEGYEAGGGGAVDSASAGVSVYGERAVEQEFAGEAGCCFAKVGDGGAGARVFLACA